MEHVQAVMVGWGVLCLRRFGSSFHGRSPQEPGAVHADTPAPADDAVRLISDLEKEVEMRIRSGAAQGSSLQSHVAFQRKSLRFL